MIQIDPARCTGCNLCVDRCAYEALLPIREEPDGCNCPGTGG